MGWAVHRPCFRAGVNEKYEDEWWLNERKRDDRATAADMLLSWPVCAEMNHAMLDFTGVSCSTSEENMDLSESRKNRDMKDTQTPLNARAQQNPFTAQKGLRNIMNGVPCKLYCKCR